MGSRVSSKGKEASQNHQAAISFSTSSPIPSTSSSPSSEEPLRPSGKYDVLVCHSTSPADVEEANRLVAFLEAAPRCLRCFLWDRDTCPGAAVPTELCQALRDSYCKALLITPAFLQDDWCRYMMLQALADGAASKPMIPLIQDLSHDDYPEELKFNYYIDLSRNPRRGYSLVSESILEHLGAMKMRRHLS